TSPGAPDGALSRRGSRRASRRALERWSSVGDHLSALLVVEVVGGSVKRDDRGHGGVDLSLRAALVLAHEVAHRGRPRNGIAHVAGEALVSVVRDGASDDGLIEAVRRGS